MDLPSPASFFFGNVQLHEGLSTERSLFSTYSRTTPVIAFVGCAAPLREWFHIREWSLASFEPSSRILKFPASFWLKGKGLTAMLNVSQSADGQENGFSRCKSKASGRPNILYWTTWQCSGQQILNATNSGNAVAGRV